MIKKSLVVIFLMGLFSVSADAAITVQIDRMKKNNSGKEIKKLIGHITFKDSLYGLKIIPNLNGLSPGRHGFHLHGMPSCDHFGEAAGGHYDPKNTKKHLGPYHSLGHLGDFPALMVNKKGVANQTIYAPRLKEKDLINHAVIIHLGGDNYSDIPKPLGGGGERIACGVVR